MQSLSNAVTDAAAACALVQRRSDMLRFLKASQASTAVGGVADVTAPSVDLDELVGVDVAATVAAEEALTAALRSYPVYNSDSKTRASSSSLRRTTVVTPTPVPAPIPRTPGMCRRVCSCSSLLCMCAVHWSVLRSRLLC